MGEYSNHFWGNLIAGATSITMIGLTIALVWTSIYP
jgi:hypothetical protein